MAINDIFKSLTVGGINSLDYGVYITGEAVYNAPEKRVEFISIPGRSGDLVIDNGVYENIEVKYPAGVFGDDQSDFASKIRAYRNALKSQSGYQRITDTYNPNEYRLGLFVDPFEVDVVQQSKAGEFDIVFNCQPYRFLTSGETAVSKKSGTLTNPTLFKSSPLLAIEGYGDFSVNGYNIHIENDPVGNVLLPDYSGFVQYTADFSTVFIMPNDPIEISDAVGANKTLTFTQRLYPSAPNITFVSASVLGATGQTTGSTYTATIDTDGYVLFEGELPDLAYSYGTLRNIVTNVQVRVKMQIEGQSGTVTNSGYFRVRVRYSGNKTLECDCYVDDIFTAGNYGIMAETANVSLPGILIQSTAPKFGHPTYIDCELGEAYALNDGVISSLNRYIALGSALPVLDAGANTITSDATITQLLITPRWREL